MNIEELFVGGVAITLGVLGVIISIGNWDTCYRSSKFRWIESIGGRTTARWTYAVVGVPLVILGIAIALGFAPNAVNNQELTGLTGSTGVGDKTKSRKTLSYPVVPVSPV